MDEKTCLEIWAKKNYFVDVFNVSAQAMVIRLKQLGLLIEDHRNEQFAF
jgi:hypothetical protein